MPASSRALALILLPLLAAACGGDNGTSPSPPSAPFAQIDLVTGAGAQVLVGSRATVAYAGWLYDPTRPENKGSQFDAGASYTTQIGVGAVIACWDRGVPGLRVGGRRRLVCPADLAYGSRGSAPVIPPNATLLFDIELLAVQ